MVRFLDHCVSDDTECKRTEIDDLRMTVEFLEQFEGLLEVVKFLAPANKASCGRAGDAKTNLVR